jgi:hypothetical protein
MREPSESVAQSSHGLYGGSPSFEVTELVDFLIENLVLRFARRFAFALRNPCRLLDETDEVKGDEI